MWSFHLHLLRFLGIVLHKSCIICPAPYCAISTEVDEPVSLSVSLQSRWRTSILESRKCPHRPGESSASHVLCREASRNCQRGDCLRFTYSLRVQSVAAIRPHPPLGVAWWKAGNHIFSVKCVCIPRIFLGTNKELHNKSLFTICFVVECLRWFWCFRLETEVPRRQPGWTCLTCGWS